jgi:hypothetical protein
VLEELVEWVHEACAEVLPDEHGPGHVDIRGAVALQQMMDLVREVEVARNDPDVERDPRLLLELGGMTLDARNVRVDVGSEEADGAHRGEPSKPGRAVDRLRSPKDVYAWRLMAHQDLSARTRPTQSTRRPRASTILSHVSAI